MRIATGEICSIPALALITVADRAKSQLLASRGNLTVNWLHRNGVPAGQSDALIRAVQDADIPTCTAFAWITGESGTVRALRPHFVGDVRRHALDRFHRLPAARPTEDDA